MISFDDFAREWIGHRVGDDSLVVSHEESNETKYQCVSLIKQYLRECFSIEPGTWGNAIAYWSQTNPALLAKFSKDGSGTVQKGDIVILHTLGHTDYSGNGHIGIATGNGDPNSIEILEQNGLGSGTGLGGDAIRTRFVPRNRLAGVLRPIPVIPTFDANRYKVPYPTPKQVRLNKLANKWDYNYPDFNSIAAHSVGTEPQGYIFTAVGFLSHPCGETYYLESMGDPNGWNIKDADDYTPPPPAPQVINTPAPVINRAETYTVITKLMVFPSATDAKALSNYTGSDLEPGVYYVFAKDNNAFNLSTSNVQNQNKWVRITDNVIKPVVEAIPEPVVPTLPVDPPPVHDEPTDISDNSLATAVTVKFQYAMIKPIIMESNVTNPKVFYDLEQPDKRPTVTLNVNSSVEFSMTATDPSSGDVYYIPTVSMKKGYRHGIPEHYLVTTHSSLDLNHNNRNDLLDIEQYVVDDAYNWTKYLETGFQTAKVFITDVVKPDKLQPVVERSRQFSKGVMDIVAKKKGK